MQQRKRKERDNVLKGGEKFLPLLLYLGVVPSCFFPSDLFVFVREKEEIVWSGWKE